MKKIQKAFIALLLGSFWPRAALRLLQAGNNFLCIQTNPSRPYRTNRILIYENCRYFKKHLGSLYR
jgi:hypothetical protein